MKHILWLSIVLAVGLYICGPIQDPDLWWHITSGRWILSHGSIPHQDYWNMFGLGTPWRAYSWSNEVIYAIIDSAYGERGLLVLKMLLSVLIAASFFYCFGRISSDWFLGGLLGIFATAACFNHFTLRPQSLVWIYFSWLLWQCESTLRNGISKRTLFGVFLLMMLWANTHLSAVLGILGIVAWLWPRRYSTTNTFRTLFLVTGIGFLGTLATPYIGGEWITFLHKTAHPLHFQAIAEFQPATILQYSTGFLILIIACLLGSLHFSPGSAGVSQLLACLVYAVGGLAVVKFLPFSVIFTAALIAHSWNLTRSSAHHLGNLAEAVQRLRAVFIKIPREGLSFVCICASIVSVSRLWNYPLELRVVPATAVDFIQAKNLPHPILNTFGHGGYLMYRFSDKEGNLSHPVTIDGRTNVMPLEVWEKYMAAQLGKRTWHEYLDLVKPHTILWRLDSPFISLLLADGNWCMVFKNITGAKDDGVAVFVEKLYFEEHRAELSSENCH